MAKIVVLLSLLTFVATTQAGYHRILKNKRFTHILRNGKIVGGEDTDITNIPYQVQVEYNGYQACGGAILSDKYVLTVAHCTDGLEPTLLKVRYGTNKPNSGGTTIQVAYFVQHPNFNFVDFNFDVCVLRVIGKIIPSGVAQPIALASVAPTAGEDALVSGWGWLPNGVRTEQLQSVVVPVIDRAICNSSYYNRITDQMICGGVFGKGVCFGDSGVPFVTNNLLSGVFSWALSCGNFYPSVYTNVAALKDFIDANTANTARWV